MGSVGEREEDWGVRDVPSRASGTELDCFRNQWENP